MSFHFLLNMVLVVQGFNGSASCANFFDELTDGASISSLVIEQNVVVASCISKDGVSPIAASSLSKRADVVLKLLDAGADPNRLSGAASPLYYAIISGCETCAEYIEARGGGLQCDDTQLSYLQRLLMDPRYASMRGFFERNYPLSK